MSERGAGCPAEQTRTKSPSASSSRLRTHRRSRMLTGKMYFRLAVAYRDRLTGSGPGRHPTGVSSDNACCRVFKDRRASSGESLPHHRVRAHQRPKAGPASIALARRLVQVPRRPCRPARQCSDPGRPGGRRQHQTGTVSQRQHRTWTVTVRSRSRSSKSRSTICCQVPRTSCPPTIGIDSEEPTIAARMCAWELLSWLSRLCA